MTEATSLNRLETEAFAGAFLDLLDDDSLYTTMLEGQAKAIAAIEKARVLLQAAIAAAVVILARPRSRLIYCGAGTSGRVALLDAVEIKPTFNWPDSRLKVLLAGGEESFFAAQEGAEDDEAAARAELAALSPGPDDVVVGLAASGTTPFVLAAIKEARRGGALTIGLANNADTPLLRCVDYPVLLETGAEALAGSTRLAAGTSQKIALNIFSTMVMVRLGKVYQGRMVDMRATNTKLQQRAVIMVADLVGCSSEDARSALQATNYSVSHAVLVARGASPAEATAGLAQAGGVLAKAIPLLFG